MELGAGKSGLVGLAMASLLDYQNVPFEVVITDGNEQCTQSLRDNVELNSQFADKVSAH
mgnify:CR=1 FL=1